MNQQVHFAVCLIASLLAGTAGRAEAVNAGLFQFTSGDVRVQRPDGTVRQAAKGEAVTEGDTILTGTGGTAQLRMSDDGLIALRADSQLRIETYRFAGKEDGSEKGILGLIKGGFRTLTGIIGRANKNNYLVRTPTATIGIRGTDHEPIHVPPTGWEGAPGALPGTYNKVNVGETFIESQGGRVELSANQVGFAAPIVDAKPVRLERVPDFFRATPQLRSGPQAGRGPQGPPPQLNRPGMPPPPPQAGPLPAGQLPPLLPLGMAPPVMDPSSGGVNPATAPGGLSPAPFGFAGVGGDKSGAFAGNGGGVVGYGDMQVYLDGQNNPGLIVANNGGFTYMRGQAPQVGNGATVVMDGATPVPVRWGIYAGGLISDQMGSRQVDFFHFMSSHSMPPNPAFSATYNNVVGFTRPITEQGLTGLFAPSVAATVVIGTGSLTSYSVSVTDALNRSFSGSFAGAVPLAQFAQNGVSLSGAGLDTNRSHAAGVPIGPTGEGLVSSYTLFKTNGQFQTGSFVACQGAC